jgi:hypothetical protein
MDSALKRKFLQWRFNEIFTFDQCSD